MASAPSASWNSRCITHLANCPNRSLPTNSSDESKMDWTKTGQVWQGNCLLGIERNQPILFWTPGCYWAILPLGHCRCNRPDKRRRGKALSYREAVSLCAGHAQQLGGESPPPNLMEVKG